MPVGKTEQDFKDAAAADGVALTSRYSFPWINERGHFGLPDSASGTAGHLHNILLALAGQADAYAGGRLRSLTGDLLHEPTGTIIEVDELQHFSSARSISLDLYPADAHLGFDIDDYKKLCRRTSDRADTYYASKGAKGFTGRGGRTRQRAYYDSLRDLAAPTMGLPPVLRIPAIDDDGSRAYMAVRDRIRQALGL